MCSHEELSGIACDKYDWFISKGSSPWDYCHYLLVEEAWGKVTDWEGNEFDISKDNIVASNGIIHDALLQAVK
jgi:myo-inositol-1(or 4)-monophosphatase